MRKANIRDPETIRDLEALIKSGATNSEIADYFGVSERTVSRWRGLTPVEPPAVSKKHGTQWSYATGCRCSPCREAQNRAQTRYYDKKQEESTKTAINEGKKWTEEDDRILLEVGPSAASKLLGRSYAACRSRATPLRERSRRNEVSA